MVCGLRFGGIPPRGSAEEVRLVENLEQKKMLPLLSNPQQLLDMTVLALHFTSEGRDAEAMPALRFIQKNMAAMQVQDCLQVWWYISQLLSVSSLSTTATSLGWVTSPRRSEVGKVQGTGTNFSSAVVAPVSERARFVLQEVRDAAKEQVLRGEKAVTQKLSVMEKRLLKSLQ
ncbi:hypothetical_protein [Leishmania braziliensis MHOM/BR/75/M2904]|nr:hypothetical_protein [Leishmania braziliensis MHOM/BR/75/M2904]